nr:hypothetical protein [Acidiferrobacterales bacterium]
MSGEKDLNTLLRSMSPVQMEGEFVFCTFDTARYGDHANLNPVVSVQEAE